MKSLNSSYIPAVDHVRAFAAILVLFQHCYTRIGGRIVEGHGGELTGTIAGNPLKSLMTEGHTGVALFMVLSGFIFTQIAYGKKILYGPFLLNRVLRIYPLMLAIFAVGCIVHFREVELTGILAVLAIPFQIIDPIDFWFVPDLYPFTTLFWTIAPEFQFYLIFPVLLTLMHRNGPVVLAIMLLSAIVLRGLLVLDGADAHDISYWTLFGRIDQFLIGMGAALVYRAFPSTRLEILCPLAMLVMLLLLFGYNRAGSLPASGEWKILWTPVEGIGWAAFIVGYLRLAPRLPDLASRVLASIGEISFSMYLLHVTVIAAVLKLGPITFGLGATGASFLNGLLFVLPGTIVVSWVTFRLIERPFLRLRVRYLKDPDVLPVSTPRSIVPAE